MPQHAHSTKPFRAARWKGAFVRFFTAAVLAVLTAAGCADESVPTASRQTAAEGSAAAVAPAPADGTIVCMGDSLTEGLGVDEDRAYPARLERLLREKGYRWRVVNAGISGETSTGALSRVDWVMTLEPDIVILETGANDGMRGIDPALLESNLDAIVEALRRQGVTVVLAGMKMLRNLGPEYTQRFDAVYPRVAQRHGLIFVPFFLEGVAADPALNQDDGIHPNADGYRVVADTLLPYAVAAIERHKG